MGSAPLLALALPALALARVVPDCELCLCSQQDGIERLQCRLGGAEDVVLDGGALGARAAVLSVLLEAAASVEVRPDFLAALRRYHSVAVDFRDIGQLSLPAHFEPGQTLSFIGVGILNCSLSELPQGVVSHSQAMGLRLQNSRVGTIRRRAFTFVDKVRYMEITDSEVETFEGPQAGWLHLYHRKDVHYGSHGFLIDHSSLGVIEEGAIHIKMESDEELVQITASTIGEVGRTGIEVSGAGSFLANGTTFGFLNTAALDVLVGGRITLERCAVLAAAALPLARVRGGAATALAELRLALPPSAGALQLDRPTGQEQLDRLLFRCRGAADTSWAAALAGRATVPDGQRRFLRRLAAAAGCDGAPPAGPAAESAQQGAAPSADSDRLFGSPARLAVELALLAAAVAAVAVTVLAVRRCRPRPAASYEFGLANTASDDPSHK